MSRWSLRSRLTALVFAALLPMMGLTVGFAVRDMAAAVESSHEQLRFAAALVANGHDRTVQATQQLLAAAGNAPGMGAPERAQCDAYFERLRALNPQYLDIGLLDAQGRTICHANRAGGDASVAQGPQVERAVREQRFVAGELVAARPGGRPVVSFALPVVENARVERVVFAALDLEVASAALATPQVPEGARLLVVDAAGRVLLEHPGRPGRPLARVLTNETVRAHLRREISSGEAPDSAGEQRVFAVAPTQGTGGAPRFAMVSVPREQVAALTWARVAQQLGWLGLTLLASLAAAWYLAGRTVLQPARKILGAVRRLEQGSLDARVLLDREPRTEFGRIGQAFNLMADSLQLRQRELESELGRSRRAYAVLDTVLNTMQEGLIAVDPGGQVLMHNRAAARVLPLAGQLPPAQGWPAHFGLYQPGGQVLCPPGDTPFARALRGETGEMPVVLRNRLVPGSRLLRCGYRPLANPTQETSGGLVVFIDITDLKRAESDVNELRAVERALRDANQELEAFSYSVSHDLRAPLGAIDGFSKALADRLGDTADDKSRHYLSRIRAGVVRMEQLIEALLGLSRVTRTHLQVVDIDLSALAQEVLESLRDAHPQREVAATVRQGLRTHGDLRLVRALLENLLGNAWKFTAQSAAASIEVGWDEAGQAFFVRDNGVGFDMAHAGKLFSAFQRLHTEAEFPGTGIGLATVRRVVARHGGRVWAQSSPGEGTTIFFTLGEAAAD